MNGSALKGSGGTNLDHHRAISLENVKDELARGREQLAKLRERDRASVDPEVLKRLEKALDDLEKIIRSQ
jgi:hypothetical protein